MNLSYSTEFLKQQQLTNYQTCDNWRQYYSLIENKCINQQDCVGVIMNNYWCVDHCFKDLTSFTVYQKQDKQNWCEAECKTDFVAYTGLCLFQCPQNLVNQSGICVSFCLNGFIQQNNVCQEQDKEYTTNCNGDQLVNNINQCRLKQQKYPCQLWTYKGVCTHSCPEITKYNYQTKICDYSDTNKNLVQYNKLVLQTCFGNKLIFQDKFNNQKMSFCTDRCIRGQLIFREAGLCVENCSTYELYQLNQSCVLYSNMTKRSKILNNIYEQLIHQCQINQKIYNRICLDKCQNYNLFQYQNQCLEKCKQNQFTDDQQLVCLDQCIYNQLLLNGTKYCVKKCPDQIKYSYEKQCIEQCPQGTFTEIQYNYCYTDCKNGRILYNQTLCLNFQNISIPQWFEIIENNKTNCYDNTNKPWIQFDKNFSTKNNTIIYDLDEHKCTNIQTNYVLIYDNYVFQVSWCPIFYYYNNNHQMCDPYCSKIYPYLNDQECRTNCTNYTSIENGICTYTCQNDQVMSQTGCIEKDQCQYAILNVQLTFQQTEQLYCTDDCSQQQHQTFYSTVTKTCIKSCELEDEELKVYLLNNWSGICYKNCPNNTIELNEKYCDTKCFGPYYLDTTQNICSLDCYNNQYKSNNQCIKICNENQNSFIQDKNLICQQDICNGTYYSDQSLCFNQSSDSFLIQENFIKRKQNEIQNTCLWKSICQGGIIGIIICLIFVSWAVATD